MRGVGRWAQRSTFLGFRGGWASNLPVLAVALIASGCWSGSPSETEVDFMGEVVSADTSNWHTSSDNGVANSSGGIDSQLRVGPGTLHLANGMALDVPADIPGGNHCSLLGYRDQPRTATCLVAGGYDDNGAVSWFVIQPLEKLDDGSYQLAVDRFEGRDAIVLVGESWVASTVRPDATLKCSEPGDLAATPVEVPSRAGLVTLNGEGEVVAVECLYHG